MEQYILSQSPHNLEVLIAALIALYYAAAVYLLMSAQLMRILMGVVLLGNGVNLTIFTAGRVMREIPPVIPDAYYLPQEMVANPLPQALILTAIVISFSLFAFLLVLSMRAFLQLGTDNVDEMRLTEPEIPEKPPLGY